MNLIPWLAYLSVLIFYSVRIESLFTPSARAGHSAVLYDGMSVYFQGGEGSSPSISSEFFYLNFSTAFDTTNESSIPWVNLTFPNQPSRSYAFSCVSGKSIFIFGDLANTPPPIVEFDFVNQSWNAPTINGLTTQSSSSVANQCLTVDGEIIYMFAGDVITFNAAGLSWVVNSSVVTTVRNKNNVILPNGTVVFVGGEMMTGGVASYILYQRIWTYNTKDNTWTGISTNNNYTSDCIPTSSVLVPDGRIIIFGCFQKDIVSGIVVLDTGNNNEFSIPNISNQGPSSDLVDFTATLVGKYILIAFGRSNVTNEFSSNIYLLDVSQRNNFTWTTSFNPKASSFTNVPSSNVPSSGSSKVNGGLIAGVIIVIAILIVIVLFLLNKRSKYMNSVRGGYLNRFGFRKNTQQNTFIEPYQETSTSPHQDVYTYNPTPIYDGGGNSETSDITVQNMSHLYDSREASGQHLSRSSSVYSRETDYEERS